MATRPLLPSYNISPWEEFLQNIEQYRRDGRLFPSTSHEGDPDSTFGRCLAVLRLLLGSCTDRNQDAWNVALKSSSQAEGIWNYLTRLEKGMEDKKPISQLKQMLCSKGYLLSSNELKHLSENSVSVSGNRLGSQIHLRATIQIWEIKEALIQSSLTWTCDKIFNLQQGALKGILKDSTKIWELKQLYSEVIQRRAHPGYRLDSEPTSPITKSEYSLRRHGNRESFINNDLVFKDLHSPREYDKGVKLTLTPAQIATAITTIATPPVTLGFYLMLSSKVFSLVQENLDAKCNSQEVRTDPERFRDGRSYIDPYLVEEIIENALLLAIVIAHNP